MSVLAFARATAPSASGIVDQNTVQKTMVNFTHAAATVTAYCNAVKFTNLPIANPNPQIETLATNFKNVKTHAENWLDKIGPSMTKVPQAIINFNNDFQGQSQTIIAILQEIGGKTPTKLQKFELLDLLNYLLRQLDGGQQIIDGVSQALNQFDEDLAADYHALTTGAASITNALQTDKDAVIDLTKKVLDLKHKIDSLTQILNWDIGRLALGIFACIVGAFLEFIQPEIGTSILVGGVVGIGTSISGIIATRDDIKRDQAELSTEQQQLDDDKLQIVVLNSVADTVTTLVMGNGKARLAMLDVASTWTLLTNSMKSVITRVEKAEGEIGSVLALTDIQAAQAAWSHLLTVATDIQTALGNITLEPPVKIAA